MGLAPLRPQFPNIHSWAWESQNKHGRQVRTHSVAAGDIRLCANFIQWTIYSGQYSPVVLSTLNTHPSQPGKTEQNLPFFGSWEHRVPQCIVRVVLKGHPRRGVPLGVLLAEALLGVGSESQLLALAKLHEKNVCAFGGKDDIKWLHQPNVLRKQH